MLKLNLSHAVSIYFPSLIAIINSLTPFELQFICLPHDVTVNFCWNVNQASGIYLNIFIGQINQCLIYLFDM